MITNYPFGDKSAIRHADGPSWPETDRSARGLTRFGAVTAAPASSTYGDGEHSTRTFCALPLADRIQQLRSELAALERLQRQAQHDTIAAIIGPRVSFSAKELWQHQPLYPELAALFAEAGIQNARQLGKRLPALGFARIGCDYEGAIWLCE